MWKNQENDVQKFIDLKMGSNQEGMREGAEAGGGGRMGGGVEQEFGGKKSKDESGKGRKGVG